MAEAEAISIDEDGQRRRQKQQDQQHLDSILDAALDALDDDSDNDDDDGVVEGGGDRDRGGDPDDDDDGSGGSGTVSMRQEGDNTVDSNDSIMGVPYSLDYLSNSNKNERRRIDAEAEARRRRLRRPQFGPEPPPAMDSLFGATEFPEIPGGLDSSAIQEAMAMGAAGEDELAASLEGMMKQFTEELGKSGMNPDDFANDFGAGLGGDGNNGDAEKALDDMFKQMMMGEGGINPAKAQPSKVKSNKKSVNNDTSEINDSGRSTPRKRNGTKTPKAKEEEPNVDESINRLLDGINQATNAPLPDPNLPPPPGMMPDNMDPAQFEKMSEDMMNSFMGEFTKMSNSKDSNDVVDGVMKQLLDKELMYSPMKEVCTRFPAWLATNKDELSEKDYERYGKQYQYFQKIVHVYETDPNNFDRLMELMQDIQEYGQPPVDIIKELAPELEFDEEGLPIMDPTKGMGGAAGGGMPMMMPGMPFPGGGVGNEQCCIS